MAFSRTMGKFLNVLHVYTQINSNTHTIVGAQGGGGDLMAFIIMTISASNITIIQIVRQINIINCIVY